MEKKVVLVLDANQRSALASTRSLGSRPDTTVITCDCTSEALAGNSTYSSFYLSCPDPKHDVDDFVLWIIETIEKYNITCLFPVTEISSRTLLAHREKIKCQLPFASLETVVSISNKNELMKLAELNNVPIPATSYYDNAHSLDINTLEYPIVIKPSLSRVYVENKWIETKVHVVQNSAQLSHVLSHSHYLFTSPFMTQEFIEGHGAGIFTYYQHGSVKAFFAHKRLREKPPRGGVSVLSESTEVDEKMRDFASRILNSVNWHGAAMIEYRVARDGTPHLMEINTRLWGSLQLAIDAGVDFPSLLLDGEDGKELTPITNYKKRIQLRWLLGDLDNLYLTLKDPVFSPNEKLKRVLQFFTPKIFNRKHEVNRLSDLKPFLYELKKYVGIS
ncbi:carboxylate--amine ligase [Alteromonas sp. S167]|uniref:carboxylate--amine ligase n=1 Tax=Alteromonas sp. S167 TaxID=3117402 RepID=UPI002FE3B5D2